MGYRNSSDPTKLWAEIKAAERVRDDRLVAREERISRLCGPWAAKGFGDAAEYDPKNRLYEFLAYVLPRTSFRNPRTRIRSRRTGVADAIAKALQSAMNRWSSETNLKGVVRRSCFDYLLDWPVAMVTPGPVAGQVVSGRPIWWPQAYDVDIRTWFMDPVAKSLDSARFAGHAYLRDKEMLVEEAKDPDNGWDKAAVQALAEEAGVETVRGKRSGLEDVPARGEVALYEVWCPEPHEDQSEDPDDGFNGTLYTLGCSQGQGGEEKVYELREPRPFYGPRTGPYVHTPFLEVPDLPYGLSPTIAAEQAIRDSARTDRANLRSAARHKVVTTVPAGDPTALAVAQSPDGFVVPIKGDPQAVKQLALGGVTQEGLTHAEMKGQDTDRLLGMADAQRGVVTGEGTASEVLTAQQGSDVRIGDVEDRFKNTHVAGILRVASWYACNDDRFQIGIEGMEGAKMMLAPTFRGGKTEGFKFEDLELEIEPYSMEYESAATKQMRVQRTMELAQFLATTIPQAPWMPWKDIIPEMVEDMGLEEAFANIDVNAAVEWASQMAQFEGQQQPKATATSGRQSQGRPINVSVKAGGGRGGKGPSGYLSGGSKGPSKQAMGGGKSVKAGQGRVA